MILASFGNWSTIFFAFDEVTTISVRIDSDALERTIMKHIPEEMMEKPEAYDIQEEITEMPENMKWIYDTEGIAASEGIKNSGGIMNYVFALTLFFDTIDNNSKVIRDAYDSGNIRLFTIKVHALKSSAKIIGAEKLSSMAAKMEEAGNKEDRAYIDENTDSLLFEYSEFKERLSRIHESDNSGKELIPEKTLCEAYKALADVIPQMDYDSVEMILDSLKEYALPDEEEKRITELEKMLRSFDWEEMENLMAEIYRKDGE